MTHLTETRGNRTCTGRRTPGAIRAASGWYMASLTYNISCSAPSVHAPNARTHARTQERRGRETVCVCVCVCV
jgi:hypothetical protein